MKNIILPVLLMTACTVLNAQVVYIEKGSNVTTAEDANLVIHSSDLINNSAQADFSKCIITMTGSTDNKVTGSVTTALKQLSINKPGNKLILNSNLKINEKIEFIAGNIELNGADINLISPAILSNENETSRIFGDAGGEISTTVTLTNPNKFNPGNLGLTFTTNADLGKLIVRRGHAPQTNNDDPLGIKRYYQVDAENNNYTGTLRFSYFDSELNGESEPDLVIWSSNDEGFSWVNRGSTSKNVSDNYIESTELTLLERYTLNEPLPGNPYATIGDKTKTGHAADVTSMYMQVLPNPVAGDQKAIVKIFAKKALRGDLVIYSIRGQAVKQMPVDLNEGINTLALTTQNLLPGTYIVSLIVNYEARKSVMFLKQ